jgi:hypothetical protein
LLANRFLNFPTGGIIVKKLLFFFGLLQALLFGDEQ